jgi:hypothetical protein
MRFIYQRTVKSVTFSDPAELEALGNICEIARRFLEANNGKVTDFSDAATRDMARIVRLMQSGLNEQD